LVLNKTWFRFIVWLASCFFLLYWYYQNVAVGNIFTIDYIVNAHHVSPWGVLFLCFMWLILKRGEIKGNLHQKVSPVFVVVGSGLVVLSALIPVEPEFIILKALVTCLGLFTVFFGKAFVLPAKLLTIYAFTIIMPMVVETYFERPYALAAVWPAALTTKILGLPVTADAQILTLDTFSGERISVIVTGACAGPATMAVYSAIFMLMMMDIRLPNKAALGIFLFGAAGTWFQNIIRIVVIMASGYFGGSTAFWKAHFWTIYILFPLWYLVFTAIYFNVLNRASLKPGRYSPRRA